MNFKGNVVVDALCTTDSIQCTNNAIVGGTLNVTGAASFATDSLTYNGNDRLEVAHSLTNSKVNGFITLYFNTVNSTGTPTESGKVFTGQGGGSQLLTASAHPVKITAGPGLPQIEVAGTGTRAVTN